MGLYGSIKLYEKILSLEVNEVGSGTPRTELKLLAVNWSIYWLKAKVKEFSKPN